MINENIKNISFENSLNTSPEILKETSKQNNNNLNNKNIISRFKDIKPNISYMDTSKNKILGEDTLESQKPENTDNFQNTYNIIENNVLNNNNNNNTNSKAATRSIDKFNKFMEDKENNNVYTIIYNNRNYFISTINKKRFFHTIL